MNCGFFWRCQK